MIYKLKKIDIEKHIKWKEGILDKKIVKSAKHKSFLIEVL